MARTANLVLGLGSDGLGAMLLDGSGAPVEGRLDPARLAAIEVPEVPGGVGNPEAEARVTAAELAAARQIDAMLSSPGMSVLRAWINRRRGAGVPWVLVIDARTEAIRRLPFELLGGLPTDSPFGGVMVARAGATGGLDTQPSAGIEVMLWNPAPTDPVCARLADGVRVTCQDLTGVRLRMVHPDLVTLPARLPNHRRVVHVVANGEAMFTNVLQRTAGPDPARHRVEPLLVDADLVVLDVCDTAVGWGAHAPARRFLGAHAVLAPSGPLPRGATLAATAALYPALGRGDSIADAVEEVRGVVRGLGLASARWWMPTLIVGDGELVTRPLVARALLGFQRPVGDAPAETVLAIAARLAATDGYFGVEHIALALAEHADPILLRAFAPVGERRVTGGGGGAATPTRPARTMLGQCVAGFHTADLARGLMGIAWVADLVGTNAAARLLTPTHPGGGTMRSPPIRRPPPPPDGIGLLVEGGPEDGRVVELTSRGQVLGRFDPDAPDETETRLFRTGPPDVGMQRRHLVYEGGRRLQIVAPTRRNGLTVEGAVAVMSGDILVVGATWLRVL